MKPVQSARGNTAILNTVADLRSFVKDLKKARRRVALVPTMGALHEGHIDLVRQAHKVADDVIVSIFVNPTQFGPNEDFSAYPRTWDADLEKLAAAGTAAVFHPSVTEMYPAGFATKISIGDIGTVLCGACRPGHFDGVATVVAKLLLQALPDAALFGEKDWQQLQVIRRVVADLDIPVEIVGVPTVRDKNGLALSSRNAYLDARQYGIAIKLNRILFEAAEQAGKGRNAEEIEAHAGKALLDAGFDSVDYVAVRDAATLGPPGQGDSRVLAAAHLGRARLIDNVPVEK